MNQQFMNTTPIDFESIVQAALNKQAKTLEAERTRALKEQASHFEGVLQGLQNQLADLSASNNTNSSNSKSAIDSTTPKSKEKLQNSPKVTQAKSKPPLKPQKPVSSSKGQRKSIQGTQATPSPSSRKRHPAQLLSSKVPKDFQRIKDALFLHIRMLWGLFEQNSVPAKVDPSLSKEFYNRFNSISDLKNAISDPQAPELISQEDIISLRQGQAGRFKLGRGLANIDEMHILYVHAMLAKVGICIWGPNLEESHDSLFNSACRITALNMFQQLLASGASIQVTAVFQQVYFLWD